MGMHVGGGTTKNKCLAHFEFELNLDGSSSAREIVVRVSCEEIFFSRTA